MDNREGGYIGCLSLVTIHSIKIVRIIFYVNLILYDSTHLIGTPNNNVKIGVQDYFLSSDTLNIIQNTPLKVPAVHTYTRALA